MKVKFNEGVEISLPHLLEIKKHLKTLAHPIRLTLLSLLGAKSQTVGALEREAKLEQSICSQHLARLRRSGLVETSRSGKFVEYSINKKVYGALEDLVITVGKVRVFENTEVDADIKSALETFRILAHKERLEILAFIDKQGETTVNNIYRTLNLEQSHTSQVLALFRSVDLVKVKEVGKLKYYELDYCELSEIFQACNIFLQETNLEEAIPNR